MTSFHMKQNLLPKDLKNWHQVKALTVSIFFVNMNTNITLYSWNIRLVILFL